MMTKSIHKAVIGFDPGITEGRRSGGITVLSPSWCASWPMPVIEIKGRRMTDHSKVNLIMIEIADSTGYFSKIVPNENDPYFFPQPGPYHIEFPYHGAVKAFIEEIPQVPSNMISIEPPKVMPGSEELHPARYFVRGGKSTLALGENWGSCMMACEMKNIPFELVSPRTWQTALFGRGLHKDKKIREAMICEMAIRKLPMINFTPKGCREPNTGMAASALIALYGTYREGLEI